ncbi:hypothetical protein, partial [Micromonospora tarensis]|uniref:hypothetical protein n=1 Tax=Micromonospora tarensis TaxID=2806100 RepID=UPI001EE3BF99
MAAQVEVEQARRVHRVTEAGQRVESRRGGVGVGREPRTGRRALRPDRGGQLRDELRRGPDRHPDPGQAA